MTTPKVLYLLDAYALIYRSYYAFINKNKATAKKNIKNNNKTNINKK